MPQPLPTPVTFHGPDEVSPPPSFRDDSALRKPVQLYYRIDHLYHVD